MNHSLPLQPAVFLVATAALLLMHSDGVGAAPVADSFSCASRVADDEAISIARDRVTSDVHSAIAARAQLVREHLSVFDGSSSLLSVDLAQEEFQSQRAELREARLDLARIEEGLDGAVCARPFSNAVVDRGPVTALEIRMELPAAFLRPLQQALIHDSDTTAADDALPLTAETR